MVDLEIKPEQALLVLVSKKGSDKERVKEIFKELESLADTAGAVVVDKVYQELETQNSSTLVGKGKVQEIKEMILLNNINIIIFEGELSPAHIRNLSKELEIKVIDRSGLILDIFAKHARSVEAKTQVELAQLQYLLPRLTRMWTHLSKQFGGIGTKGPGETQIETDRRIIRLRIQRLKEKLNEISTQKEQQRKGRSQMPRFALVGYTNAGKSTLVNTITQGDLYVEDKLFATLDTTVRQFDLPSGMKGLISDTVGFIRNLPTHLIASFRSTLAEASEADIIIHVIDISNPYFREHIKTVNETLAYLKLSTKPIYLVFNKIDNCSEDEFDYNYFQKIETEFPGSILISAKNNININNLLSNFEQLYHENSHIIQFLLPYTAMDKLQTIYANSEIVSKDDKDDGILFTINIHKDKNDFIMNIVKDYLVM